MSSFTSPLRVSPNADGRTWTLTRKLEYRVGDSTELITVPKGYKTDLASIPRIFWSILPPFGKYTAASVLHDFSYFKQAYTRRRCDEIFLEAMKVLNVAWWKRRLLFRSVRIFGGFCWRKKRK